MSGEQRKPQSLLHREYPICKLCHMAPEAKAVVAEVAGKISGVVFTEIRKYGVNTTKVKLQEALGEYSEGDLSGIISQGMKELREDPEIQRVFADGLLTPQRLGQLLRYTPKAILKDVYGDLCRYNSGYDQHRLNACFNNPQGNGSTRVGKKPDYSIDGGSFH